jgi:DNA-binding beta-propeller fold protein YncE
MSLPTNTHQNTNSVDQITGHLTQVQEAGPYRGTLLTSAGFDPQGQYLYAAASFGNHLVWAFTREPGGLLTTVVDPELEGGRDVGPPQGGSYAAVLPLDAQGLAPLLLVAVEKENLIYAAQRSPTDGGRLKYFPSTAGGDGQAQGPEGLRRPVSMSYDADGGVLFVAEGGDNAISAYRLTNRG